MKRLLPLLFLTTSPLLVFAQTTTPPAASGVPATSMTAPAPTAAAPTEKAKPVYVAPAFLEAESLKKFLGNFPVKGSPESDADIAALLKLQAARTPDEIARINTEVKLQPEVFATVLGPWFDTKNLPLTAALLKNALNDARIAYDTAKDAYGRPRPFLIDSRIQPCIELPKSPAYPSGHTTVGVVYSLVLAELAPDLRKDLLARGALVGKDREIAGVHYPSDVKAGKKLAHALFERFLKNPQFQTDLAKAKVEFTAARHASAAVAAAK